MPGSTSKKVSQRNRESSAMCFWRCPCWKKLLNNMKMLVQLVLLHNFLHNHMRYTFIDRFTIWKEKSSVLIKLVFLLFLQTVVQTKFSVSSHSRYVISIGCGLEKPFRADPGRSGSFHACALLGACTTLALGSPQSWYPGFLLFDFFHSSSSSSSSSPSDRDVQGRIWR